ncbi:tegument protein U68 [Proboscivirus elephantidbeta4]|uniref:Tegument protein U68 n=1 Tax=Elephant endotheliotropic herpesvirus 4 TaxID=548914 RepID=A0A0S1TQE5_9BETA|nr:tegument protein U68 [Elephant endotheliotropic herpesvirus 4]ALM26016.1 tegument protein U68 [Elephant endotheliotropic herpesvirus 4]
MTSNHMTYVKSHLLMTVERDHHMSLKARLGKDHALTRIQAIKTKESHGTFQFAQDKYRLEAVTRSLAFKRQHACRNRKALKDIETSKVDAILVTSEGVHDDVEEIYHAAIQDEHGILNDDD